MFRNVLYIERVKDLTFHFNTEEFSVPSEWDFSHVRQEEYCKFSVVTYSIVYFILGFIVVSLIVH